jgi:hypothetical protein
MGHQPYDVFLSHAGEQKPVFVDCLHTILTNVGAKVSVFMDEHSLEPGDHGWDEIDAAANTAHLGADCLDLAWIPSQFATPELHCIALRVVAMAMPVLTLWWPCAAVLVLSREFVCKKAPMAELKMLLERWKAVSADGKRGVVLVPVVWALEWKDLEDREQLYAPASWPAGVKPAPDAQVAEWKSLVEDLTKITSIRLDQVRHPLRHSNLIQVLPRITVTADAILLWCRGSARPGGPLPHAAARWRSLLHTTEPCWGSAAGTSESALPVSYMSSYAANSFAICQGH